MSEITKRRPINWKSVQYSHTGLVRKINEDAMLSLPEQKLWAVADGMGGYEAGNIASDMIISSLKKLKLGGSLNETVNRVEDSLIEVNNLILAYADILLDGRILGSTVVTLIIKGRVGISMWAGDSRLYRYRNRQLEQLTRDHSYVANQVMQGQITAKEAGDHPDSNKITRAVGADSEIYIDINAFSVQLGDIFLLCSDGLYNKVSNNEIAKTLASLSIKQAVNELVLKALDNGADDNVSVVLILGEPDKSARR
jgi:serine/threonine protein phosphatase PrpC